jgi:hypothetical protein
MARHHMTVDGPIPFTTEEEAEWDAMEARKIVVEAEEARLAYQRQRTKEYPLITDYIDGIVKGDTAQVQTYIDACLAVKAKYPKPE